MTDVSEPEQVVLDPSAQLPDNPQERAQMRLARLTSAFASILATVAEMCRDEDWRYLTRDDGSTYGSLAEVLSDTMHVSQSMARRYVQGARTVYLPLSDVIPEGTLIEITSGDIAALGVSGASEVVEEATERLDGVTDPEESAAIISDTISDTKAKHTSSESSSDGHDGAEGPRNSGGDSASSSDGRAGAHGDGWDSPNDVGDDVMWGPPGGFDDDGDVSDNPTDAEPTDPMTKMMGEATPYTAEDRARLDEPLQSVAEAMATLAEADPNEIAQSLSRDTLAVLRPAEQAMSNVSRVRALVEAQPWMLALLAT